MGSTSASAALIHNLHLNSSNYFRCLNYSNKISRTSLLVTNQRRASKLKFFSRKECKKFSRVVCCAVEEDVTEKQQEEEFKSAVGSAVEEKPGKTMPNKVLFLHNSMKLLIALSSLLCSRK